MWRGVINVDLAIPLHDRDNKFAYVRSSEGGYDAG